MNLKDYKELKVWQKGIEIVDRVYEITAKFPDNEAFSLSKQMRNAAVSVPSNVAEGFMRRHIKEYVYFLYISLGSCAELETQTIIANRRHFMTQSRFDNFQDLLNHEMKMLMNLIKRLRMTND